YWSWCNGAGPRLWRSWHGKSCWCEWRWYRYSCWSEWSRGDCLYRCRCMMLP
ncbi:hypothetical protein GGI08_007356, partial [Coemansia sp. S2]